MRKSLGTNESKQTESPAPLYLPTSPTYFSFTAILIINFKSILYCKMKARVVKLRTQLYEKVIMYHFYVL